MGSIRYDFNKDGIVLGFKNNDESIALDLKKNLTKYVGNLIVTDQSKTHIFPIEISKDGDAFVVSIKYTAPDKLEEIQSMNSNIRLNVIPKSNIVITAPTGATPISKIM